MILKGKHLCWSLFLIKLQAWRSAVLFKKRLHYSCFPVNIIKLLRTAFCMEHLRWLFLKMVEFLRNCISIRGICTKEFIRNPSLCFNSLRRELYRRIYNLGQVLGDTFTKLSKGFSMDCFTLIFCDFLPKTVKIWLYCGRLGTRHQIQAFQRFSNRSATREATQTFTLWW